MELKDCKVDKLGLPIVPFPITTAKREQWKLWLFRRILAGEIKATEADLERWHENVEVSNPEPEQFDSAVVVSTHAPNKLHSDRRSPKSAPREHAHETHVSVAVTSSSTDEELWWNRY